MAKKAAARKTKRKIVTATTPTILAVALGATRDITITDNSFSKDDVRPYIRGLISGLISAGLEIGDSYTIEYKQRPTLSPFPVLTSDPACVFAMSTNVVEAALASSYADLPIIGVVSNPQQFNNNIKVYVVSARRTQSARQCYEHFERTSPNRAMYVLHDETYGPSIAALNSINQGSFNFTLKKVTPDNIQGSIQGISRGSNLLVLPVAWFFGKATEISRWAQQRNIADFWTVTDWVRSGSTSAFGGYGVSQHEAGSLMAELVAPVLNGGKPSEKVLNANKVSWRASLRVAQDIGVQIPSNLPPPYFPVP